MTPAKVADLLASLRSQPVDGSGWRVTDPPRDGWDAPSIVAELRNTLVPMRVRLRELADTCRDEDAEAIARSIVGVERLLAMADGIAREPGLPRCPDEDRRAQ